MPAADPNAKMPLSLAVIISTYNAPHYLRLALDGYARQTERNFSIYIADDGSNEATRAEIAAFADRSDIPVRHIRHDDQGFRKARIHNKAIREISEDYILLTDGDCVPPPGLIAAHLHCARKNCFVSGSRVLLSKSFSEHLLTTQKPEIPDGPLAAISWRISGRINRLTPLLLPPFARKPHNRLKGIRGCHLACWREDLIAVNGFDESFEGWGREDSDLAARLLHAGIRRVDLRGMPVLHVWHAGEKRDRLEENDARLKQCLEEKRIRAVRGLAEL